MDEFNDEIEITSENRQKFIEDFVKVSFKIIKNDAQIKLLSLKAPKVKEPYFIHSVIKIKRIVDIFEEHFPLDSITSTCIVTKEQYNNALQLVLSEWKNNIYSKLSDDGITAMCYDNKTEKIFWSFIDREVHDEKQFLKRRNE